MNSIKNEKFISKAETVHGIKYDYSKINYINAKTKIIIGCKDHGDFEQTPSNHLSGYNCQKCANNGKMTREQYVIRATIAHDNKYDYSKVEYVNIDTKITIVCNEHGEFQQIPDFHLNRKCGCPKCANNVTLALYEFIVKANKIHGNKYDYSQVNYVNNRTKINIVCKLHGVFEQKQFSHLLGIGCPHCINKTEYKLWMLLKDKFPSVERQFKAEWCKQTRHLPFDFAIKDHKTIIEMDGPQHFEQVANWKAPELQHQQDLFKMKCANENGYRVIRILQKEVADESFDFVRLCEYIENSSCQNIFMNTKDEYVKFI
jgi:very-short-patch-repair endonuclease